MRGDIYGFQVGRLQVYWTRPWELWWGSRRLVSVDIRWQQ